jgi:hypothetical protein
MRPVRANLSVSRVASDAHPITTVSFTWGGDPHAVVEPSPRQFGGLGID